MEGLGFTAPPWQAKRRANGDDAKKKADTTGNIGAYAFGDERKDERDSIKLRRHEDGPVAARKGRDSTGYADETEK
jgi:hypothetical protein